MDEEKKKRSAAHSHHRKKKSRTTKSKMSIGKSRSRVSKQKIGTKNRVRPKDKETLFTLLSQNSVADVVQCFPFAFTFCPCGRECTKKNGKIKKMSKHRSSRKLRISVEKLKEKKQEGSVTVCDLKDENKESSDVRNGNDKQEPVTLDNLKLNGNIRNLMSNVKFTSFLTRANVPKTLSQVKLLLASNPNLKVQIKTILGDSLNNPNMKAVSDLLASDEEKEESAFNEPEDTKPSLKHDNVCTNKKSFDDIDVSKTPRSCTTLKSSSRKREIEGETANSQTSIFSKIVSAIFGSKELKEEKHVPRKSIRKMKPYDSSLTEERTKELREKYEKWYKNSSPKMRERFQWEDFVRVTKYLNNINRESLGQDNKKAQVMLKQLLNNFSSENINELNVKGENNDAVCSNDTVGGTIIGDTAVEGLKDISCPNYLDAPRTEMMSPKIGDPNERVRGEPESVDFPVDADISKNILLTATQMLYNNDKRSRSRVIFSETIPYNSDNRDQDSNFSRNNKDKNYAIPGKDIKTEISTNYQQFSIKRIKSEDMLNSSSGDVINRLNSLMKELLTNEGDTIEGTKPELSSRAPNSKILSRDIINLNKTNSLLRSINTQNAEDVSLCQMMCASFVEKLTKHESREGAKGLANSRIPGGRNEFQIYNLPSVQTQSPFMSSSNSLLGQDSNVESNSIDSCNGLREEDCNNDRDDDVVSTKSVKELVKGDLNNHCEPMKDWTAKKVSFNDNPSCVSYSVESQESYNTTASSRYVDTNEMDEDSSQKGNDGVLYQLNSLFKHVHEKTGSTYLKDIYKDPVEESEPVADSPQKKFSLSQIRCSSFANVNEKDIELPFNKNFQVYCVPSIQTDNPFVTENVSSNVVQDVLGEENSECLKSGMDFESPLNTSDSKNQEIRQGSVANQCSKEKLSDEFCESNELPKVSDLNENGNKRVYPIKENSSIEEMFDLEKCSKSKPLGKFLLEQHIRNALRVQSGEETIATAPSLSNTDFTNKTSNMSSYEDNFIEDSYSESQKAELRKVLQFLIRTAYDHPSLFLSLGEFESEAMLLGCVKKNSVGVQCKLSQEKQMSVKTNVKSFVNFERKLARCQSEIVTKTESKVESLFSENDPFTPTNDSGFHSKSFASFERRQFISLPDMIDGTLVADCNQSNSSSKNETRESSSLNFEVSCPSSSMSCHASRSGDATVSQTSNSELSGQERSKQIEVVNNFDSTSSSVENTSSERSSKSRLKRILKKIRIKDRNK